VNHRIGREIPREAFERRQRAVKEMKHMGASTGLELHLTGGSIEIGRTRDAMHGHEHEFAVALLLSLDPFGPSPPF
jgi:hypothetical protein